MRVDIVKMSNGLPLKRSIILCIIILVQHNDKSKNTIMYNLLNRTYFIQTNAQSVIHTIFSGQATKQGEINTEGLAAWTSAQHAYNQICRGYDGTTKAPTNNCLRSQDTSDNGDTTWLQIKPVLSYTVSSTIMRYYNRSQQFSKYYLVKSLPLTAYLNGFVSWYSIRT